VLGIAELLLDTTLDARQRQLVETLVRSSSNLVAIIVDLSKIETGRLELNDASFDLRPVVENVVERFAEHAHRKVLLATARLYPPRTGFAVNLCRCSPARGRREYRYAALSMLRYRSSPAVVAGRFAPASLPPS
jgi:signal transduction histidine kinase